MGTKNNPGPFDCHAAAEPDEPMFVLLGRDRLAASLVRLWAIGRTHSPNKPDDVAKIVEAHNCAQMMENWCHTLGKEPVNILGALPYDMLLEELKRRDLLTLSSITSNLSR